MDVSKLGVPLVMVNGNFRSLHTLTIEELESFVTFMTSCAMKKANASLSNGAPKWWARSIDFKFPLRKPRGLSDLGYLRHLQSIVCKCYCFHDAHFLLTFSSQFAEYPQSIFLRSNPNNTTSVFSIENVAEIFTFDNENKDYDSKPTPEDYPAPANPSSSKVGLPRARIVGDIYLCENCDVEFYNHVDIENHEKDCFDSSSEDSSNEIEVLTHIRPPAIEPGEKEIFLDNFGLVSTALQQQEMSPVQKPPLPVAPVKRWVILDMCLHKNQKIEFSSVVGRHMLKYRVKRDILTRAQKAIISVQEVCDYTLGPTYGRDVPRPRITYKAPKKKMWAHTYCFSRKQKMDRLMSLKTGLNRNSRLLLKECKPLSIQLQQLMLPEGADYFILCRSQKFVIPYQVSVVLGTPASDLKNNPNCRKMAASVQLQQAEEKVKKMFSWSASLTDSEIRNMHDNPAFEGSRENLSGSDLTSNRPHPPPLQTQHSTVHSRRQQAVCVRHAFKHYGSSKNPNHVLSNLNMTVAKGTIYGLLGASGCGKTTLLSCIVGRRRLNTGEIWVLGGKPGTRGSGVPGKRVGYMPQEIALYGEFSIKETMMYFGWIFGMDTSEINDRLQFLLNFLDLPSQNRLVKNLSGGQQRRVSFAVALMHDPELLILDEPTVGVDPLLRQSIWTHLVQITKDGNKTVIITTHYIEEARQAHTIGLMRSGRLLAEESPQVLLSMYGCQSLEEVFLKLSRKQGSSNAPNQAELNISNNISLSSLHWSKKDAIYMTEESGVVGLNFQQSKEALHSHENSNGLGNGHLDIKTIGTKASKAVDVDCDDCGGADCCKLTTKGKIRALLQKNFLRMWRNVGVMLFIFALPVMQVILFCLAIGRDPTGLKLAIVNHEMDFVTKACTFSSNCSFTHLSCRYLNHLNKTIIKEYYETPDKALDAVRLGDAWGALYFTENFTDALVARMALGRDADEETLDQSEIRVWLDMSNQQIGLMLNRDLQLTYRTFAQELLAQCDHNPKLADIPIQFKDPIYGSSDPSFTDFVAPGVILTIVFFLAVALTSSALIIERMEGLLDRSWVAGVTPFEILFSHVVTQFVVMCGQTALVLIFMICVFKVECNGPLHWIVILTILQGLCGMCFGFVISAICELERNAIQLALGSFYPTLLLSGVIWPVEGMPIVLRYISMGLPLTMATSALRSMLTRGWDIEEPDVYNGFIATIAWIVIFLSISLIVLKLKRG